MISLFLCCILWIGLAIGGAQSITANTGGNSPTVRDILTFQVTIDEIDAGSGTFEIHLENMVPFWKFILTSDFLSFNGAIGGRAEEAGFTVSYNSGLLIGDGMNGPGVQPGAGVLTTILFDIPPAGEEPVVLLEFALTFYNQDHIEVESLLIAATIHFPEGCMDPSALNYNQDAMIDDGSCDYSQEVELSLGAFNPYSGTIEIWLNNPGPLAVIGFQFIITGLDLTGSFGGIAADVPGWQVSTGADGTVLCFNFGLSTAPPGNYVLTNLMFDSVTSDWICITEAVFSGWSPLTVLEVLVGSCLDTTLEVPACTDPQACNYEELAVLACDDCCEFSQELELHPGNNLVSFYALPSPPDIENVLTGCTDVTVGVVGEGEAAVPHPLFDDQWIGSMQGFSAESGYWIIVAEECRIAFCGVESGDLEYNLHDGANLISYPYSVPQSLEDAIPLEFWPHIVGMIGPGLSAVPCETPPCEWWGSLNIIQPGQGYWLKLDSPLEFYWNPPR